VVGGHTSDARVTHGRKGGTSNLSHLAPVRRVPDERAYLYELIRTIGAGPDLPSILDGVVTVVTEATACHAALIWFVHGDELVLRCASAPYAHLAGVVRMGVDEGLGGWVVQNRRSAFIREDALDDPRVRYFPELEEERFQSLVSVPIFGRSGDVLGVIALHAEAPHEFERADLDLIEHTASLIAGAVENARIYEQAAARVRLLSDLSALSQRIASAADGEGVLAAVIDGVNRALDAERCEVLIAGPDGRLRRHDAGGPGGHVAAGTIWVDALSTPVAPAEAERVVSSLWNDLGPGVPVVAPLIAQNERLGLIAAWLPATVEGATTALASVAAHTAVALKQHELIEWLTERNLLKDFLLGLSSGELAPEALAELARRLRCDLDSPHVVVHIVPWSGDDAAGPASGWPSRAATVEGRLAARFPGALIDTLEGSMRALIPLAGSGQDEIEELRSMDWGSAQGTAGFSVGASEVCRGVASYVHGFAEAMSAAEVGTLIRPEPGVTTHGELGPYRYVVHATEGLRDPIRERLEALVAYDTRRNTRLLETLEAYLDRRGNLAETSRALYVHPNTLRQRLDRITQVCGIDLERDDWLSVAVATKVVKLHRLRSRSGKEEMG
jgi:sugar diacid utilization regulator/putative methionine-R-sulfoxide reductase with GAF domain